MRVPRHRLFLCAAAVLALVLLGQAWDRLQGHLHYVQVQELKDAWHETNRVPHDRELSEGFKLGYRASEYESANADYRFILASLHAWREKVLRLWPDQEAAETRKVIENLKSALLRRPSWFEAWILLALVKFQAGEIDHELQVALEKAIETGPYETAVHHGLSLVAPRVWDGLGPDLRKKTVETLHIALDNPRVNKSVVEQIVMSGQVETFREKLESDKTLKRLMNRYLEKRKATL